MVKRKILYVLPFLVLSLALLSLTAFAAAPAYNFGAQLTGSEEVPPVLTLASGQAKFTLSANGLTLHYKVTVANIANTVASHIHLAPEGVNGPVVATLFIGIQPGLFTGTLAEGDITAANLAGPLAGQPLSVLITAMEAGGTYVNVHSVQHPGGEIRGQIAAQPNYYNVFSNFEGKDIPLGANVIVTGLTNDPAVNTIEFHWLAPGIVMEEDHAFFDSFAVTIDPNGTRYATSEHAPNIIGNWEVHVRFLRDGVVIDTGVILVGVHYQLFVVPEIPLIGTAGSIAAMLSGFAYTRRKKLQKLKD
jgi:hypothetical protein